MNTTIKLGVASALAFGAAAAHASIPAVTSGASDVILFANVLNSSGAVIASYAGDTAVSINAVTGGTYTGGTVLGSDANLAALFAADGAGDTIQWAVEGGQYTGLQTTGNFNKVGVAKFVTDSTGSSTAQLTGITTAAFIGWGALANDVAQVNTNSGGKSSVESGAAATGGVWDYTNPSTTSSGWYGDGPVTGNTLGTTATLFYLTGSGAAPAQAATALVTVSKLGLSADLTANGLVLTTGGSSPPPVPLPAAFWLLGSGLLGLTGVARRKSKA